MPFWVSHDHHCALVILVACAEFAPAEANDRRDR